MNDSGKNPGSPQLISLVWTGIWLVILSDIKGTGRGRPNVPARDNCYALLISEKKNMFYSVLTGVTWASSEWPRRPPAANTPPRPSLRKHSATHNTAQKPFTRRWGVSRSSRYRSSGKQTALRIFELSASYSTAEIVAFHASLCLKGFDLGLEIF